jgi:hypothetical protein
MDAKQFIMHVQTLITQYDLLEAGYGFAGCSDVEIEALMKAQGVSYLPPIFIEFARTMGRGAGGYIFRGEDFGCLNWKGLKQSYQYHFADAGLDEEEMIFEPTDIFVFMGHQGYMFWFFHTDPPDENPPVFGVSDEKPDPIKVRDHFSEFLLKQVEYWARLNGTLRKTATDEA